jgi:uncharacterized membrane protein YraQ (UPF0718 family)
MAAIFGLLLFTMTTQMVASGIAYNDDVANEIARQKAICKETDNVNAQIVQIDNLIKNLNAAEPISAENDELISQLSDTIRASIKNINDLKKQFMQKLLIMLVTNILIVAIISIYIINKVSD